MYKPANLDRAAIAASREGGGIAWQQNPAFTFAVALINITRITVSRTD